MIPYSLSLEVLEQVSFKLLFQSIAIESEETL